MVLAVLAVTCLSEFLCQQLNLSVKRTFYKDARSRSKSLMLQKATFVILIHGRNHLRMIHRMLVYK